jgi:hypothetical protein
MAGHLSFAELNRLQLIRACDETIRFIEVRRAEMREELVQKFMKPRFFGYCRTRESAEAAADFDGSFGPSYKWYAWRSLQTAESLKKLAEASTQETVSVAAGDFDDILIGWRRTESVREPVILKE